MPPPLIRALGIVKKAAALTNRDLGVLETAPGGCDRKPRRRSTASATMNFRWWSGRPAQGTQSNMNANEVIANRAIELLGGELGTKDPFTRTTMSTARNPPTTPSRPPCTSPWWRRSIRLLPALHTIADSLHGRRKLVRDIIKIGRTHTQDATPLTLGQEFSGYAAQLETVIDIVARIRPRC